MQWFESNSSHKLDMLERISVGLMAGLVLLTFVGVNAQALLWQSSDWLVGTILPAVVVDLTNDERNDYATTPLRRNSTLDAAASAKASHMANQGYFSHYAPDGTSPWHFFEEFNYVYAHAGENLAIHFTDSSEVVEAWMDSPSHKENIVNQDYTEIGVGTANGTFDGHETIFVVQLFGAPAVAPVVDTSPKTTQVSEDQERLSTIREELLRAQQAVAQLESVEEVVEVAQEDSAVLGEQVSAELTSILEKEDVFIVESRVATSSGLAVAILSEDIIKPAGQANIAAGVLTRPNLVLDVVYSFLVCVLLVLLSVAMVGEIKRSHYIQAAYGLGLLALVGVLWSVHTSLTGGAVIL